MHDRLGEPSPAPRDDEDPGERERERERAEHRRDRPDDPLDCNQPLRYTRDWVRGAWIRALERPDSDGEGDIEQGQQCEVTCCRREPAPRSAVRDARTVSVRHQSTPIAKPLARGVVRCSEATGGTGEVKQNARARATTTLGSRCSCRLELAQHFPEPPHLGAVGRPIVGPLCGPRAVVVLTCLRRQLPRCAPEQTRQRSASCLTLYPAVVSTAAVASGTSGGVAQDHYSPAAPPAPRRASRPSRPVPRARRPRA